MLSAKIRKKTKRKTGWFFGFLHTNTFLAEVDSMFIQFIQRFGEFFEIPSIERIERSTTCRESLSSILLEWKKNAKVRELGDTIGSMLLISYLFVWFFYLILCMKRLNIFLLWLCDLFLHDWRQDLFRDLLLNRFFILECRLAF